MDKNIIEKFKNREIKAKQIFDIKQIKKNEAYEFIREYHYLGDAKFFAIYNYGLYYKNELVGCATYSNPQGSLALKSWFGLPNSDQSIVELSRLCMLPQLNGTNATSFLLGNSIKMLKNHSIRAVTTLADSNRHIGSIYQVCNFKYYGLTDAKTDFFTNNEDGKMLNNPRMKTKDVHGVWLPRTRKHRYCYILDKTLKPLYEEQPHPTVKGTIENECCYNNEIVYDERFNEWWTCPRCTKKLELVDDVQLIVYDDYDLIRDEIEPTSRNYYIVHFDNVKASMLKNQIFDCVITTKENQKRIQKYLYNCRQCFTYDFSDNEPFYSKNYREEFYESNL